MQELVCHGVPAMVHDSSKKYLGTIERDKTPLSVGEIVGVGGGIINRSSSESSALSYDSNKDPRFVKGSIQSQLSKLTKPKKRTIKAKPLQ